MECQCPVAGSPHFYHMKKNLALFMFLVSMPCGGQSSFLQGCRLEGD